MDISCASAFYILLLLLLLLASPVDAQLYIIIEERSVCTGKQRGMLDCNSITIKGSLGERGEIKYSYLFVFPPLENKKEYFFSCCCCVVFRLTAECRVEWGRCSLQNTTTTSASYGRRDIRLAHIVSPLLKNKHTEKKWKKAFHVSSRLSRRVTARGACFGLGRRKVCSYKI